jgi:hypothetical protein
MSKQKIIVYILLLFVSISSYAKWTEEDVIDYCTKLSDTAELVMSRRHEGVAMSSLMPIFKGSNPGAVLGRSMVVQAYEHSRLNTKSFQATSIEDFKNDWFLDCYKQMNKQK